MREVYNKLVLSRKDEKRKISMSGPFGCVRLILHSSTRGQWIISILWLDGLMHGFILGQG